LTTNHKLIYMTLAEILKDSSYKLTQFNLVEIDNLENYAFKL